MNTQYNDPKGAAGALKTPLGLIPPYAMEQIAWAHKHGAEKYGPFNWRDTGVCASTYINAMMRHINAFRDGENLDPESGISHLAHIACSCNILLDADFCDTLQDDRNVVPNADIKFMSANGCFSDGSPYKPESELDDLVNDVLEEFYADNNGYVALAEDATIEEGDEYYDTYECEWVKSSYVGMPITVSRLLYRRPIKQQDDSECPCGRYKINYYTLGLICEDCDLQWQDPY